MLTLLGSWVPTSLKVSLVSLAIPGDIGAIIIALFYTDGLSTTALTIAAVSIALLFIGSLAFENAGQVMFDERIGIMPGSLISGLAGYLLLRHACSLANDECR